MTTLETTQLDEQDTEILLRRFHAFCDKHGPREGDYVRFSDGVMRRISFITPLEWLPECDSVQTSDSGSWYLGEGYCSFSGSLFLGVKRETLRDSGERKPGRVWFFHHDYRTAHNGVETEIDFRVFNCSESSTR